MQGNTPSLHLCRDSRAHGNNDIAHSHQHGGRPVQIVDGSNETKVTRVAQTGSKDGAWHCMGMNYIRLKLADDIA
jgi:hypothetical protein